MPLPNNNDSHASGLPITKMNQMSYVKENEEINEDEFDDPGDITIRPGQ